MTEYRASFDATVTFSNGGDLAVRGFRVDVPSADIDEAGIAALFVASLGLLMTDSVELSNVQVVAEPHKGTRGGPSDPGESLPRASGRLVELSHVIRPGMVTYPGLPGPAITPYLTREASRAPVRSRHRVRHRPAHHGRQHRNLPRRARTTASPTAPDLSAIPLARTADLPAVVIRVTGARRREIGTRRAGSR